MHHLPGFSLAVACLLSVTVASAQRRSTSGVLLLPEAQIEVALQGNDYLVAGFNLAAPTQDGGSTFASGQLRLGYEHFWNERWSIGGTLRLLGGEYSGYGDVIGYGGNATPGLLLRHRSKIGGFQFGQRLGLEYAITIPTTVPATVNGGDRSLVRLRLDVERVFALGTGTSLRPRLAYEPAAYLRLQRGQNEEKERFIDFGNLRAELGIRLSPRVDLTPWGAFQTIYINSLPSFDAKGNQIGGGRTNLVFPVVGLDMRLTLGRRDAITGRLQLPTQH